MKFSKKSWHYKLHKITGTYNLDHNLPKSLCGYFWLTLWRFFTFPLVLIFALPTYLINKVSKDSTDTLKEDGLTAEVFGIGALSYAGGYVMTAIVVFIVHLRHLFTPDSCHNLTASIGFAFSILLTVLLIVRGIQLIFIKIRDGGEYKVKEPGLVSKYISAKKAKICPLIEWKD